MGCNVRVKAGYEKIFNLLARLATNEATRMVHAKSYAKWVKQGRRVVVHGLSQEAAIGHAILAADRLGFRIEELELLKEYMEEEIAQVTEGEAEEVYYLRGNAKRLPAQEPF